MKTILKLISLVVMTLFNTVVFAQTITIDVDEYVYHGVPASLDVMGDGIPELEVSIFGDITYTSEMNSATSIYDIDFYAQSNGANPTLVDPGFEVNDTLNFEHAVSPLQYVSQWGTGGFTSLMFPLSAETDYIIPIRISINGMTGMDIHYGWMVYEVVVDGNGGYALHIKTINYESTPGQSVIVETTLTSLDDQPEVNELSIYPTVVATGEEVHIEGGQGETLFFDQEGKQVLRSVENQIKVNLTKGTYIVQHGEKIGRIIVE